MPNLWPCVFDLNYVLQNVSRYVVNTCNSIRKLNLISNIYYYFNFFFNSLNSVINELARLKNPSTRLNEILKLDLSFQ